MVKIKQKNAEGVEEEIEVSTQAEVDAKIAAERESLQKTHQEEILKREESAKVLAKEKADLEQKIKDAELNGMKEDHPNFKILKEALNKKDEDIKSIKKELDDDKSQRVKEEMESQIKIASKGNAEFEKKIKFHLEKTLPGLPEGTKEQRETKLAAAFKLAADSSAEGQNMFDGGIGGGGPGEKGMHESGGNGTEFSAKERSLGAKLGISDADYKKYGPKVPKR